MVEYSEAEQWKIAESYVRKPSYPVKFLPGGIQSKVKTLRGAGVESWDTIAERQQAYRQQQKPSIAEQEQFFTPATQQDLMQQTIAPPTQTDIPFKDYRAIQEAKQKQMLSEFYSPKLQQAPRGSVSSPFLVTPSEAITQERSGYSRYIPVRASSPEMALEKSALYAQAKQKGDPYAFGEGLGTLTRTGAEIKTAERQIETPMTFSAEGLKEIYATEYKKAGVSFSLLPPERKRELVSKDVLSGGIQLGLGVAEFGADWLGKFSQRPYGADYDIKFKGFTGLARDVPLGKYGESTKYAGIAIGATYGVKSFAPSFAKEGIFKGTGNVLTGLSPLSIKSGIYKSPEETPTDIAAFRISDNIRVYGTPDLKTSGFELIGKGTTAGAVYRQIPAVKVTSGGAATELGEISSQTIFGTKFKGLKDTKSAAIFEGESLKATIPMDTTGISARASTTKTKSFGDELTSIEFEAPIISASKKINSKTEFAGGLYKGIPEKITPEVTGTEFDLRGESGSELLFGKGLKGLKGFETSPFVPGFKITEVTKPSRILGFKPMSRQQEILNIKKEVTGFGTNAIFSPESKQEAIQSLKVLSAKESSFKTDTKQFMDLDSLSIKTQELFKLPSAKEISAESIRQEEFVSPFSLSRLQTGQRQRVRSKTSLSSLSSDITRIVPSIDVPFTSLTPDIIPSIDFDLGKSLKGFDFALPKQSKQNRRYQPSLEPLVFGAASKTISQKEFKRLSGIRFSGFEIRPQVFTK